MRRRHDRQTLALGGLLRSPSCCGSARPRPPLAGIFSERPSGRTPRSERGPGGRRLGWSTRWLLKRVLVSDMSAEADVVVVGFGGAGACAALEARAEGAEVVVLDRFSGGGATAISGGVVYAGGGTSIQREAGIEDDPAAMLAYLRAEVQGVVSEETLRDFCARSVENLDWLAGHGVPFEASLCPVKTSYPTDDYYLYYSGNEGFSPFRELARPAPRGHRAKGKGLPGQSFYAPLKAAAQKL